MKRLIWLLPLVALMHTIAHGQTESKKKEAPVVYRALLGTDKSSYEQDGAFAGGEDVGGEVLVLVNGNPIDFYSSGGSIIPLNHWIRPRNNELTIKGAHSKPLYVKIAKSKGQDVTVILKREFPPAEEESSSGVEFKIDISYKLSIYAEGNVIPDDKAQVKRKLLGILQRVHKGMAEHDAANVVPIVTEGMNDWRPAAYNMEKEQVNKFVAFLNQYFGDKGKVFEAVDWDSLKFVFGTRIVMVYTGFDMVNTGFDETGLKEPYLFRFKKGEMLNRVPPMQFARISGKWVVWE